MSTFLAFEIWTVLSLVLSIFLTQKTSKLWGHSVHVSSKYYFCWPLFDFTKFSISLDQSKTLSLKLSCQRNSTLFSFEFHYAISFRKITQPPTNLKKFIVFCSIIHKKSCILVDKITILCSWFLIVYFLCFWNSK